MKNFFAITILIVAFTFGLMLTSCKKKEESTSATATSLNIPNLTGAVSGTASTAISGSIQSYAAGSVSQQAGVSFSGTAPSDPVVSSLFTMVTSFVSNAKISDTYACMIEALANNGLLSTDGTETIFADDQNGSFRIKFSVNASGSTLQNFKMFVCMGTGTTNEQYVEGTLSGSNISFNMKFNFSGLQGSMAMDGTLDGSNWLTKTLTMETVFGTTYTTKFQVAQNSSNMIVKGTYNTGSTASTYQMYGKFGLLGSTPATYSMSEGSSKYSLGGAADQYKHWNSSGSVTGVTTSSYAADVTAGTYFPANVTFGGTMTAAQTWTCATGATSEIKVSAVNSGAAAAIQSCSANQQ